MAQFLRLAMADQIYQIQELLIALWEHLGDYHSLSLKRELSR
jgi:hypothetical protein